MSVIRSTRTLVAAGALGLGLLAAPAIASASPASAHPTSAVHPAVTATTPKTTPTTTTTPKTATAPVAATYTVVAGTFRTQAQADKRLAKITAKDATITGMSVVKVGKTAKSTRYRVEQTGMTRADAKTLWKLLRKDHFFAYYTAH
jgi:cell division protein FtsN